ncbi:MAG TPA: SPFH domain-containing protein [Mycobacteriales bacterium]|jgi:regulator of protease activity HflC (stomatin/prohibitin superfamily)|nr:SPFH domain-containing protein [Mycobacteriales bacterium]
MTRTDPPAVEPVAAPVAARSGRTPKPKAELPAPMGRRPALLAFGLLGSVLVVVLALLVVVTGFDKTSGGEVGVVRNGGPLDNNRVRQVIQPASNLTWTGMFSQVHKYPSQQRFYTITSDDKGGDRPGVDVVRVPSSDGVDMGLEGTLYFSLTTDEAALRSFDDKFGTRRFTGLDGEARYPWEGDEGWVTFLDQIIRPIIDNDLRAQVAEFRCAQLVSSCALVQNSTSQPVVPPRTGGNNSNIAQIQNAINKSLADDLRTTLGGDYLTGLRFNLVKVTLPAEVQAAVNQAQAQFAKVSEAQAKVAQAAAEAQANERRQTGYTKCPTCAQIDITKAQAEVVKSIPPNVTVYAPGNQVGLSVPQPR